MMVHEFLEHRTAPARRGKSNRSWNIAYLARRPLCNWAHPDDGASWPSTGGNEEITKHTKSPKKKARVELTSAYPRARRRSCIVDRSSTTEPASVRVVPP